MDLTRFLNDNSYQRDEGMRGKRGRKSKGGNREEDPIYFE